MLAAVTFVMLLFLMNFWSVNANVFLEYSTLNPGQIDKCTHVKVKLENKKSHTVRRYIVPIIINSIATQSGLVNKTYQIEISKKRLLYSNDRKTFTYIPFPIKEPIEIY